MPIEDTEKCYATFQTIDSFDFMTNDYKHIDIAKSKIISMFKGDTSSFDLQVNIGTLLDPIIYTLEDGDILKFYLLYPNSDLDMHIFCKEYTKDDLNDDDSVTIKFDSEDTIYLNEGIYYYTIKLHRSNDEVITLQKITKFILMN